MPMKTNWGKNTTLSVKVVL